MAQRSASRNRAELWAHVIFARELIEVGRLRDGGLPHDIVVELEIALEGLEEDLTLQPIGVRCENCGLRLRWPGELDDHPRLAHWGQPWRKAEAA